MYEKLFTPCSIGSVEISNRIAMDPLQNFLAGPNGECTSRDIEFYKERAKGGVGMITTGTVCVDLENGRANARVLGIDSDELIKGYHDLAEELHFYGTKIFVQLFHPGRQGLISLNNNRPLMAPSAIPCNIMKQETREMTADECRSIVKKFIEAAKRCRCAGIDGVTLHCAHGYLLQEFLSPYTNKRTDEYGGSLENRARIVCDIIKGIKECFPSYPVIVRMSADEYLDSIGIDRNEGITLEMACAYAKLFEECGADAIDVSAGMYETMNTAWEPMSFGQGWKAYLAGVIKRIVNIPVICTSALRDPAYAEMLIEKGICDFVGSARAHFADPEWSNKARRGQEKLIRPCISCLYCFETLFDATAEADPDTDKGCYCAMNVRACRELQYETAEMDGRGKTVVIVGAGPAGLEAAVVLAMRRFDVIVLEKSGEVGGQLNIADKSPHKGQITKIIDYYKNMIDHLHIDVRCNVTADADLIKSLYPDAVIIASGSVPKMPKWLDKTEVDPGKVCTPQELLSGRKKISDSNVIVIGSGMSGLETAESLASAGNKVMIFEAGKNIGNHVYFQNLHDVLSRVKAKGIEIYTGQTLVEINSEGCIFKSDDEKEYSVSADQVVLSMGAKSVNALESQLKDQVDKLYVVGDADRPGRIADAVKAGFEAARAIKFSY